MRKKWKYLLKIIKICSFKIINHTNYFFIICCIMEICMLKISYEINKIEKIQLLLNYKI